PIMLVEQAMMVEKAGMVAGAPASMSTSRAILLQVRLGTTLPHTAKSGTAPPSWSSMLRTTGTESSIASSFASAPPDLAHGERVPTANQVSVLDMARMAAPKASRGNASAEPAYDRLP